MNRTLTLSIVFLTLLAACAPNETVALRTQNAWARPAAAGQTSALYLTIFNPSGVTETLQGVSVTIARAAEMHQTMEDSNGVVSMHPQHAVEIPARGKVEFAPGGLHIMLIELKQDLKPGDTFIAVFHFKRAGTVSFPVIVQEQ